MGDDLREGKPTPLLAVATERANAAQQQVLARVGTADLSPADIVAIQTVIDDTGARADSERRIAGLTAEAAAAIVDSPLDATAVEALQALAHYVGTREH